MTNRGRRFVTGALGAAAALACVDRVEEQGSAPASEPGALACDAAGVRDVATRLGDRLRDVSLLAPDAAEQIRAAYAPLVTAELLETWAADPTRAPGRSVSSPWPDRIEVTSVTAEGERCRLEGEVVSVASGPSGEPEESLRERVVLTVLPEPEPRVVGWARSAEPPGSAEDAAAAADVIRRYFAALAARDFRRAYDFWGPGGPPGNGQRYEQFVAGFAETATVEVDVGDPGPVEAAAGSRFVAIPVTIRATTRAGERQRFVGSYTLRRSVVEGASPEQRAWHLYAARVRRPLT
jgi:hypothetical protein